MFKVIDLDGNVVVEANNDKDFKEKVYLFLKELMEEEILDGTVYKTYKKNLNLLYHNGYILEQDGILSGNNTSLKWYYRNII